MNRRGSDIFATLFALVLLWVVLVGGAVVLASAGRLAYHVLQVLGL